MKILAEDKEARVGELKTVHGKLKTPFFMPVATKANVKTLTTHELKKIKVRCVISNAFILSLKPGINTITEQGKLHKFMNWNKGIFTDSGGFQILNPDFLLKKTDQGVVFRNLYTGKKQLFTPETSIEIQNQLSSDVAMCFDDVPHHDAKKDEIKASIKRTHNWAERCINSHNNKKQLLFGIAQGGIFPDLRKKSGKIINSLDFDGIAIGGLCIGETKKHMFKALDAQLTTLDKEKPKYLMGVGSPQDILEAVEKGIDIFDSVYPTRNARRGSLLTKNGQIKITNKRFRNDNTPIEENCGCYTCKNYTKSYLSHLITEQELLGLRLATIHNLYFLSNFMQRIRDEIKNSNFKNFKKQFLKQYKT
ncbi:tRNA guanosine(34) transglycosylase Tgt [Candidatus Woesearchaeota archaeon]|nr:tRNA guanosine(34) transglycosylase Tgt [Candidatus Woesearchaeota archaeon]